MSLTILIVDKNATVKALQVKDYKVEELYKKCGFKKPDGFTKQTEWNVTIDKVKYLITVFGKVDGKANTENKYDFPPPIDQTLFFGNCAIVGKVKKQDGSKENVSLSLVLWDKIYTKLFGGFEDLTVSKYEDEEEEDELLAIPKEKKTKQGYLKDGFVVDSDSQEDEYESYEDNDDEDEDEDDDDEEDDIPKKKNKKIKNKNKNKEEVLQDNEIDLEDLGSELSEEAYDYDT
jgi:hypothetical protein